MKSKEKVAQKSQDTSEVLESEFLEPEALEPKEEDDSTKDEKKLSPMEELQEQLKKKMLNFWNRKVTS